MKLLNYRLQLQEIMLVSVGCYLIVMFASSLGKCLGQVVMLKHLQSLKQWNGVRRNIILIY